MEYAMNRFLESTRGFFEIPLGLRSRIMIFVAALMVIPTFFFPLWQMTLTSNQFPEGLELDIYSYKLVGAKDQNRDDLKEINALNHYIGMRPLIDDDFTEFKWIPFLVGATALLALRVLVVGKMDKLVDLFVLFTYFGGFSLWSFYHKLYLYGHNLDATAAVKVPAFTPPLFGHQTMANFEVYNYPALGSYFMAAVPVFLLAAIWLSYKTWKKQQTIAGAPQSSTAK
jgi:copper chaperone NosL